MHSQERACTSQYASQYKYSPKEFIFLSMVYLSFLSGSTHQILSRSFKTGYHVKGGGGGGGIYISLQYCLGSEITILVLGVLTPCPSGVLASSPSFCQELIINQDSTNQKSAEGD
ncbi:hypothetical protein BDD12DRAFT_333504 [Trichophaea hybrida]|nr:hypothetical protein BDD12DRAFT_333504 [Trichophaea hybrida]